MKKDEHTQHTQRTLQTQPLQHKHHEEPLLNWLNGEVHHRSSEIHLGLSRMNDALEKLNAPHLDIPVIHVAGTNGKGSVCHYLDYLLQEAGLTVGRYTSPHLSCLTERFQINGQPALWKDLNALTQRIIERLQHSQQQDNTNKEPKLSINSRNSENLEDPEINHLSHFEKLTLLAFCYFQQQQPDVLILETGLGGRLDATNVCPRPELTIITNIGLDHTEFLGDTLNQIAQEKAGIIKGNRPLILGPNMPLEALNAITAIAKQKKAPIILANPTEAILQTIHHHLPPFTPAYQIDNIATAISAYSAYQTQQTNKGSKKQKLALKPLPLNPLDHLDLRHVLSHTHPARFEWFEKQRILLDGSHNEAGLNELVKNLNRHFPNAPIHFIVSLQQSKDLNALLQLLNNPTLNTQQVYWCTPNNNPSTPFHPLPHEAPSDWYHTSSPHDALAKAQHIQQLNNNDNKEMKENVLIVITGSLHTAGALRSTLTT